MTYTQFETQRFTCDKCGKKEQQQVNAEFENTTELLDQLIDSLREEGWTYDEKAEKHFCPKCSKGKESFTFR